MRPSASALIDKTAAVEARQVNSNVASSGRPDPIRIRRGIKHLRRELAEWKTSRVHAVDGRPESHVRTDHDAPTDSYLSAVDSFVFFHNLSTVLLIFQGFSRSKSQLVK